MRIEASKGIGKETAILTVSLTEKEARQYLAAPPAIRKVQELMTQRVQFALKGLGLKG